MKRDPARNLSLRNVPLRKAAAGVLLRGIASGHAAYRAMVPPADSDSTWGEIRSPVIPLAWKRWREPEAARLRAWTKNLLLHDCQRLPRGSVMACDYGVRIRLYPDSMYGSVFLYGVWEPVLSRFLWQLARPGDVVVDAGASFGWYTALLGHRVGPDGRIYAFEPLPEVVELTSDTVGLNGLEDRVEISNVGLSATAQEKPIYRFAGLSHGHSSGVKLEREDAIQVMCRFERLDDVLGCKGVGRVDLLKVDVEGFEDDVIAGALETLGRDDAPIVAFEVNADTLRARGLPLDVAYRTLAELGYTNFWCVSEQRGVSRVTSLVEGESNYVACKPSRMERFS